MRMTDHDAGQPCRIIPFEPPARQEDQLVISSIAAVIAVTVLHYEGESPETLKGDGHSTLWANTEY